MSSFSTVGLCALGTATNAVVAIKDGHDPFPTVFAGGLFAAGCVIVGTAEPRLGTGIALLFLLGSLLLNGTQLFGLIGTSAAQPEAPQAQGKEPRR